MKPETKFILLRISIYLTGFLIVAWVIGINVWEIKQKTVPLIKVSDNQYIAYTERNYDQAELTLEFEEEVPRNINVSVEKDFPLFVTHRKKGVYSSEELTQKFKKNNPLVHPNGSFLKFQEGIYFLEEGFLRKLESERVLDFFGLKKENLKNLSSSEFQTTPKKESLLTIGLIYQNFPENIIVKQNNDFFISSFEGYDPLYVSNIEKLMKEGNYPYIEVTSKTETEAICRIKTKNTVACIFPNDSSEKKVYIVKIDSRKNFYIKESKTKFSKKTSREELTTSLKDLLFY